MNALTMSEHRPQQIWDGEKTLTSRPFRQGDLFHAAWQMLPDAVISASGRVKYRVGDVCGIKPKRQHPVCVVDANSAVVTDLKAEYECAFRRDAPDDISLKQMRDALLEVGLPELKDYTLLRVKVLEIKRIDVRDITGEEAVAEGFRDKIFFLETWCRLYDPVMNERMADCEHAPWYPNHCPLFLGERPDELYDAWLLRFQRVLP